MPVDPNLATEQQQAHDDLIKALQSQSQSDTASIMARYGTRLALSGATIGTPLSSTAKV
jgi:hypothetical protein